MMPEGTVTTEENKAVVRRFYEEVHGGNLDVLDELVAPDIFLHGWRSEGRVTIDEALQGLKGQRAAFPDWKVTVHDLVAEGEPSGVESDDHRHTPGQLRSTCADRQTSELHGNVPRPRGRWKDRRNVASA